MKFIRAFIFLFTFEHYVWILNIVNLDTLNHFFLFLFCFSHPEFVIHIYMKTNFKASLKEFDLPTYMYWEYIFKQNFIDLLTGHKHLPTEMVYFRLIRHHYLNQSGGKITWSFVLIFVLWLSKEQFCCGHS